MNKITIPPDLPSLINPRKITRARDNVIIVAALIAGMASLLFNWFGTGLAITHILEDEAKDRAVRWGEFLKQDLNDLEWIFESGSPSFVDQHAIDGAVEAGNIFRYKFFNANGLIMYASRTEDIGKTNSKPYFANIVQKGQTFATVENDESFGADNSFISEAYIPIMNGGDFRGAIEVYTNVTDRALELQKLRIWAFVVLCGFTALLGGMLAIVVVRNKMTQEIAEESQIAEQALHAVNEALEERVSQRTQELEFEIQSHLETEKELVDAKMKAERANAAKSAFLSSVSHELRTPMNAIMGFAQVLQLSARSKLDERETENVRQIIENGDLLVELIDQVLDLSKLQSGEAEAASTNVSIDELLDECAAEYKDTADRKQVTIITDAGICVGKSAALDRNLLKQALLNLISNAVKFNKNGGTVHIACECTSDPVLKINVTDTGEGIAKKHHDTVFQSFQRMGRESQAIEGTGVGLSIAKGLIELMSGHITFESMEGEGSTFTIEIPVKPTVMDNNVA